MVSLQAIVIAKNEEKFLDKSLSSIRPVVDSIVFVDTGSNDRTLDIAKKYTNIIHTFDWIDDFSAAHNASLAHATSDYVLQWDADFYIDSENQKRLQYLRARNFDDKDCLALKWQTIDSARGTVVGSVERALLYRREAFRYTSPVHAFLQPVDPSLHLETAYYPTICIEHHKNTIAKAYRSTQSAKILSRALHENPSNPYLLLHHLSALCNEESYAKALRLCNDLLVKKSSTLSPMAIATVKERRIVCLLQLDDIPGALTAIRDVGKADISTQPLLLLATADTYASARLTDEAAHYYHRYVRLLPATPKRYIGNNFRRGYIHPYRMLGLITAPSSPEDARTYLGAAVTGAAYIQDTALHEDLVAELNRL